MLRAVYLGTPDFAVAPLISLLESPTLVELVAVVTNKDKPVGRKQVITACSVKAEALKHNIPVLQYDKIKNEGITDLLRLKPDIMITCAFGQILSQEILDIPKYGVINVHASLLPKYRGASPIHYAILNGETETGITIMRTDIGIDTGDVIIQKSLKINDDETCGELFERLSHLGAETLITALEQITSGEAVYKKQDERFASFSKIVKKVDAEINWVNDAISVKNHIRAYNPSPVAFTLLDGQPLKIYSVKVADGCGKAGEIIKNENVLEVACGSGSVLIEALQKAGGKRMSITDFMKGNRLDLGTILGK